MAKLTYYVYILTSRNGVIYVGVTNDLHRRVDEHRTLNTNSFTHRYGITRLVYFETTEDVQAAIEREKQIKGWTRHRKLDLIRSVNPRFEDLLQD